MKKKFWLIMLAIVSALCLAFGLTACGKGEKSNEDDTWTMDRLYDKAQELGFEGTWEELIAEFKGEAGKDGKNGKDGIGIKDIYINENGELIVELTEGEPVNLGSVKGKDGKDGAPGKDGEDGKDGKSAYDVWKENGHDGTEEQFLEWLKGVAGKDGVGIKSVEIDGRGHLMVTLTNGTVLDAGWVPTSGSTDPEVVDGTEGLAYQKLKDEDGNEYAVVTGLGMAWETDIVIPSTYRGLPVKMILAGAFRASEVNVNMTCKNITSISIPGSVISIGDGAFYGCSSLKSVSFEGDSRSTSIGSQAFGYCTSLISITIPAGVTSIGYMAFYGCRELTSVTIGSGVTSIGYMTFYDCSGLETVYYQGSAEEWGNISIDNTYNSNDYLLNATRHYFIEDEPTAEEWADWDYWWHYDLETGEPTPWVKEEQ